MSLGLYILDETGTQPIQVFDAIEWAMWFGTADRHVAQDYDEGDGAKRVRVSTIFLGINHRHFGEGPPILWETLVFGGALDGQGRRVLVARRGDRRTSGVLSAGQRREEARRWTDAVGPCVTRHRD